MYSNERHPENAFFLIDMIEFGIIICFNDSLSINNSSSMQFIDDGSVTCVKDLHLENAHFSIDFIDDGIIICFNDVFPLKKVSSIVDIDEGIFISAGILHLLKKSFPSFLKQ